MFFQQIVTTIYPYEKEQKEGRKEGKKRKEWRKKGKKGMKIGRKKLDPYLLTLKKKLTKIVEINIKNYKCKAFQRKHWWIFLLSWGRQRNRNNTILKTLLWKIYHLLYKSVKQSNMLKKINSSDTDLETIFSDKDKTHKEYLKQ